MWFTGIVVKKLILVSGAEGTGHQAIKDALHPWFTSGSVVDLSLHPKLESRLSRHERVSRWALTSRVRALAPLAGGQTSDSSIVQDLQNLNHSNLFYGASLPYGAGGFMSRRRSVFKMPDFEALLELFAPVFDVRFLRLTRRRSSAVDSCLRRGFEAHRGLMTYTWTLGDALSFQAYHAARMKGIPAYEAHYEQLCSQPETTLSAIAELLGISRSEVDSGAVKRCT